MSDYKFRPGQSVQLLGRMGLRQPVGPFKILRHLPANDRDNQYHLKSVKDGHERVATESELTLLSA